MIKVALTTGMGDTKTVVVPDNTTVRDILADNNINTTGKLVYIGSMAINDHSKTLKEIGVTDECEITYATKADGGLH